MPVCIAMAKAPWRNDGCSLGPLIPPSGYNATLRPLFEALFYLLSGNGARCPGVTLHEDRAGCRADPA